MNTTERFKQYADFSVRVDRFFYFVCNSASIFKKIKSLMEALDGNNNPYLLIDYGKIKFEKPAIFLENILDLLNGIARTGLLQGIDNHVGGTSHDDAINFAFYTCYCFQWNLFEDYVRDAVSPLIEKNLFPETVCKSLKQKERYSKEYYGYIESGVVFGKSPFKSLLPFIRKDRTFEKIDYLDLDKIRLLRNRLVHAVDSPEIQVATDLDNKKLYERDMWVLRQFAANIMFETEQVKEKAI